VKTPLWGETEPDTREVAVSYGAQTVVLKGTKPR
jgi:hypothetical protein